MAVMSKEQPRLVHVFTVPLSLGFVRGQMSFMKNKGMDVHCITSSGAQLRSFAAREGVFVHVVEMTRKITPRQDLRALRELRRKFKELKPQIVHGGTPKAGLLSMIAAKLTRVPVRIYQMRGLPYVTASGSRRLLLKWSEKIACRLAHLVICNSRSLMDLAIKERLCKPHKLKVLHKGSSNGVDAETRFNPGRYTERDRDEMRGKWDIPKNAIIMGFVGRLVRDKGIVELAKSWMMLRRVYSEAHMLLVGDFEDTDPLPKEIKIGLCSDPRVHITGWVDDTPSLYAAMDMLVLPSYREGFPNSPLEAAAMGLPVIATEVPGCVDAVADEATGLLVPPGDADALTVAIRRYFEDAKVRRELGEEGRGWMLKDFRPEDIWKALYKEYSDLLPV